MVMYLAKTAHSLCRVDSVIKFAAAELDDGRGIFVLSVEFYAENIN